MNNTVNINVRTDPKLKNQAVKLFDELGMDMTTALNIFLRQAVRENRIPFEISMNVPNKETLQAINDVKSGKNISGPFTSIDELRNSLNAED